MTPKHHKKSDRSLGLSTLQDISALILKSHDLNETISNIVTLVAKRAHSDVCSLYLLEDDQQTLLLRATYGLDPASIGSVSLKIGEGLTGQVAKEGRILALEEPQNHPHYRYFAETKEEQLHTFVGIPLFDRSQTIGVLVIQTRETHHFSDEELSALTTIAFQVASIVVNARLLDAIDNRDLNQLDSLLASDQPAESSKETAALNGHIAYPGVVSGTANVIDEKLGFADIFDEENVDTVAELKRLDEALRKTRIQTLYLEKRVADKLTQADAAIFHTHLMILEDRGFIEKLHDLIETEHSAPYALKKVIGDYLDAFAGMEDAYLRERAADMEDIGRRLLANLVGQEGHSLQLHHPGILVAKRLLPSDMATLDHEMITGMLIESNERNSHSVIMAKSLGIPALIGVQGATTMIKPDAQLILDANAGCVYLSPSDAILDEYFRLEHDRVQEQERLDKLRDVPAISADEQRVMLRANIGLLSDINIAKRNGAEGVGLYRTEFPYMARNSFPDRDEQYQLYKRVVEEFDGQSVTIRTLDIGGDKALPYFSHPKEDNPFMGWRSVRISLDNREIFQTQVEAILMAAVHGPIRLLFPMICNMEEIRACKAVIQDAKRLLREQNIAFAEDISIGAMIEVPAAVRLAPHLYKEVDFFALGTNDLIQYLLAADRGNPRVQRYYDPLHPAVLLSIESLMQLARKTGTDICVCGEMSTDPACLLALLGMGIRQFSLSAPYIPKIKELICRINLSEAEQLTSEILQLSDSTAIRSILEAKVAELN
ncbi:MAG TPA: phosphoenolpyruvate--protein phosphotransferase [Malonomonas sp.]